MKKITAIHEAAHTVIAYISVYHFLTGEITLTSDTEGETFVTLSRKKLLKESKPIMEKIEHMMKDPEIAFDVAVIFFAGLEAEKIYCEKHSLVVDESHSINDHSYATKIIQNASPKVSESIDEIISFSKQLVLNNWEAIEIISEELLYADDNTIDHITAIEILDNGYGKNSFK